MNYKLLLILCLSLCFACGTTKIIEKKTIVQEKTVTSINNNSQKYKQHNKSRNSIRAWIRVRNGIIEANTIYVKEFGDLNFMYIEKGTRTSKIYAISDDGRIFVFEAKNINGNQIIYGYEQR